MKKEITEKLREQRRFAKRRYDAKKRAQGYGRRDIWVRKYDATEKQHEDENQNYEHTVKQSEET